MKYLDYPLPQAKATRTGLEIQANTSYEVWEQIGKKLSLMNGAMQWLIGDWLNFGEAKYGEKYAQAINDLGLEYGTLRNIAWVAKTIEMSRRRDNVSWSIHQSVSGLKPKEQDRILQQAEEENLTRQDVRALTGKIDTPELPDGKYQVIYADPPWLYATDQHGKERQATVLGTHYPSMATEDICALKVGNLAAENSVLFLWTTSPKLFEAKEVIDAWGFTYKSSMIWDKVKHNVGYYVSVRHEILLICTKGSCLPDSNKLKDSVVTLERTEHSAKPEVFYELIEEMYHGKKIELFARNKRKGWSSWGNQL